MNTHQDLKNVSTEPVFHSISLLPEAASPPPCCGTVQIHGGLTVQVM